MIIFDIFALIRQKYLHHKYSKREYKIRLSSKGSFKYDNIL